MICIRKSNLDKMKIKLTFMIDTLLKKRQMQKNIVKILLLRRQGCMLTNTTNKNLFNAIVCGRNHMHLVFSAIDAITFNEHLDYLAKINFSLYDLFLFFCLCLVFITSSQATINWEGKIIFPLHYCYYISVH